MRTHIWKLAAVFALAAAARGQTSRGTVTGTILDPSGAVVVGARVTLTGTETGVRRSTLSNEAGIYRFDAVDLGVYELKVTHPGFRPFLATGIGVEANRITTIDVRLEVGGVGNQQVDSQRGILGDAGEGRPAARRQLPAARSARTAADRRLNPLSLARTLPGVTQTFGQLSLGQCRRRQHEVLHQRPAAPRQQLSAGRHRKQRHRASPAWRSHSASPTLSRRFPCKPANFGVEFGRAGGGVFNVVTKSGTNSLHGTLLWRYQSQRFNSVSNLDKLNGIPKSVFSHNVFGFTVGGPGPQEQDLLLWRLSSRTTHHSTGNFPLRGSDRGGGRPLAIAVSLQPAARSVPGRSGRSARHGGADSTRAGCRPSNRRRPGIGSIRHRAVGAARDQRRARSGWFDSITIDPTRTVCRCATSTTPGSIHAAACVSFPGFIHDRARPEPELPVCRQLHLRAELHQRVSLLLRAAGCDDPSRISPRSVPLARTLPSIVIRQHLRARRLSDIAQFRYANNLLFQETQTKLTGRHTFRYGVEFLAAARDAAGRVVIPRGHISTRDAVGLLRLRQFSG